MRAGVTQVLKTSRKTSQSASPEVCRGSSDAAVLRAQFERVKYIASEYSSEIRVEIAQTTASPGIAESSIWHPASPSQSSPSAKAPMPLPAASPGASRK